MHQDPYPHGECNTVEEIDHYTNRCNSSMNECEVMWGPEEGKTDSNWDGKGILQGKGI